MNGRITFITRTFYIKFFSWSHNSFSRRSYEPFKFTLKTEIIRLFLKIAKILIFCSWQDVLQFFEYGLTIQQGPRWTGYEHIRPLSSAIQLIFLFYIFIGLKLAINDPLSMRKAVQRRLRGKLISGKFQVSKITSS